jgi:hypothetical protein
MAAVAAVLAEALALYVVAEWIASGYAEGRHAVAWWGFVTVALVAFGLPRLAEWLALSRRATYVLFGVVAYVVIYGILRIEYAHDLALWDLSWIGDFAGDSDAAVGEGAHAGVAAFLLLGLWARESTRSALEVDLEALPRSLGPLFATVTIVAILGAMTDRAGEVGRGAAGFYAVAVSALAFSQLSLSGATIGEVRAGGITATLLGGTIAVTVVCVGVVALLLGVVGPIVGPPLSAAVGGILAAILTPPAWALEWLFRHILSDKPLDLPVQNLTRQPGEDPQPEGKQHWGAVDFLAAGFRSVLILVLLVGAAGVVMYFMRLRRRAGDREEAGPVRSSAGTIREDLASLFRSLRPGSRAGGLGPSAGAARLYREVLQRAERTGHPRQPAETPSEFAPTLNTAFHASVTDEITAAYEQARYAGREPDSAALTALERRWQELR